MSAHLQQQPAAARPQEPNHLPHKLLPPRELVHEHVQDPAALALLWAHEHDQALNLRFDMDGGALTHESWWGRAQGPGFHGHDFTRKLQAS